MLCFTVPYSTVTLELRLFTVCFIVYLTGSAVLWTVLTICQLAGRRRIDRLGVPAAPFQPVLSWDSWSPAGFISNSRTSFSAGPVQPYSQVNCIIRCIGQSQQSQKELVRSMYLRENREPGGFQPQAMLASKGCKGRSSGRQQQVRMYPCVWNNGHSFGTKPFTLDNKRNDKNNIFITSRAPSGNWKFLYSTAGSKSVSPSLPSVKKCKEGSQRASD